MNEEKNEQRLFRPKLSFYHPNNKGTGSAMELELCPAHDDVDGSIMIRLANQMSVSDSKNSPFARFDWEGALCAKLDFTDLSKILQVLRKECESIEEGKGLCHTSARGKAIIQLRYLTDPCLGYVLEITRKNGNETTKSGRIFLRMNEALGLRLALEGSLSTICFGIPMITKRAANM